MDTGRHSGRLVVVTGAASGIGRAAAMRFAEEGADVLATDVDEVALAETRQLIEAVGKQAQVVTADITAPVDVDRILAACDGRGVDVLANVAGIMDFFLPVTDVDDETWDRVMAVNLTAVMRLCRALLPGMRAAGRGSIVNVASIGGLTGAVSGAAYAASKHGLIGLTRSIAYLYAADGIRCNAVCPGGVETHIGRTATPRVTWAYQRLEKAFAKAIRTAQPDEIGTLISWLGSDEASNVNGAIITSDGGWMT